MRRAGRVGRVGRTGALRWAAVLLAAGVLAVGCSAQDTSTVDSDQEAPGAEAPADEGRAQDSGGEAAESDDTAEDGSTGGGADDVVTFGGTGDAVTGRQLARTASIILEVEDVEQAATRVSAAAQRAGGFVSDAQIRGGDFGSGFLTLRVPARALDATIEDLAEVGVRVVESSISTEDLTDQLTDLQARIDNLERLEAELQALLADVRDGDPEATQLLQVFERLNQVRGEIERLEAQRAGAQDRVALATINVELLPPSTAPEEVEPEPEGTLARAWEATQDAFGAIADALIWLVVTILPVALVVIGVPALLLWGLLTWLRQRRQGPPSPARATEEWDGAPPPPGGDRTAAAPPSAPEPAPTATDDADRDDHEPTG